MGLFIHYFTQGAAYFVFKHQASQIKTSNYSEYFFALSEQALLHYDSKMDKFLFGKIERVNKTVGPFKIS